MLCEAFVRSALSSSHVNFPWLVNDLSSLYLQYKQWATQLSTHDCQHTGPYSLCQARTRIRMTYISYDWWCVWQPLYWLSIHNLLPRSIYLKQNISWMQFHLFIFIDILYHCVKNRKDVRQTGIQDRKEEDTKVAEGYRVRVWRGIE